MTADAPDAWLAAALLAVDPTGAGGVLLRGGAGPARDAWLGTLRALLPAGTPWRRVPAGVDEGRLCGGLDLAATLSAGRPVAETGLIAAAHGGVLVVPMAERILPVTAAHLAAALDDRLMRIERDGIARVVPAEVAVIALDESAAEDEAVPARLVERLALVVTLDPRGTEPCPWDAQAILAARTLLPRVVLDDAVVEALCAAAAALGVGSLRASCQALCVARAAAALAGRDRMEAEDAAVAARLVLAPRATRMPAAEPEPPPEDEPPPEQRPQPEGALPETVLDAARAAIPQNLLARLAAGIARSEARGSGRSDAWRRNALRGRPAGSRRGDPRRGARLDLLDTLRAAVPWQLLRRETSSTDPAEQPPVLVRRDDFRVRRLKQRTRTTVIFAVDASGSSAAARMAEAKGAVELLLAECYVRRDQVALVAFRRGRAEVLLPPTRSLTRARRSLAELPGGGGTPLASGIAMAQSLAEAARRRGETPLVVLLSDGRANVDRDGIGGRAQAEQDALAAARAMRASGTATLVVDTSTRPRGEARRLAESLGARFLELPQAGPQALSAVVQATRTAHG